MREPPLADEELKHRAQRPYRLKDQARVGECVRSPKEATLSTDKTDDGASLWRKGLPAQKALGARDKEVLVD